MARQVQLKRSAVQGRVPTTSDLALGEIGINTYDGKIFIKKNDGSDAIVEFRGESNVYVDVHNNTGSTITAGVPVYVSGTHASGKPTVALADNDGSGTYPAIGLAYESIADADEGKVLISGIIEGLDTSSYGAGDALYLDSTAGALTSTRPTSSSTQVQKVGLVTRSNASAGSILVIGAGRTNDVPNEITALTGVSLDAVNLGTFTGTTISDNGTIKAALQELETAVESGGGGGVSSVNTQTGVVVLDTDDISEGTTNLYSQWSDVTGGISYTGDVTIADTAADSLAGPEFTLYRNSASPADGDYLGQIRFLGKQDNGGDQLYAKITGKTSDVSLGTEDGLIETAVVLNGSQTIVARQTGTALKLINGCGLEVNGAITTDSTIDGRDVAADGTKLDGIAAGAEVNAVDSVNTQTGAVVLDADDIDDTSTTHKFATAAQLTAADSALQPGDIGVTVQGYDADNVVTDVAPTFTTTVQTTERTITAGAFDLSTGNHWTCGAITVPAPTNATAGTSGLIRITAGTVVWNAVFKFPGGSAPTIASYPAIIPFYVQDSSNILMGNVAEGIS